jgi:uncharacterized protein YegJ (DUF2314 family)
MASYQRGDYVKVEVVNERTGETEWLWVLVDHWDEANHIVFGRLDNIPVVNTDLKLGQELAISYENIREHKKESDF